MKVFFICQRVSERQVWGMGLIVISNRLPFEFHDGSLHQSTGGVATGIYSYIDARQKNDLNFSALWAGWPGNIDAKTLDDFNRLFPKKYIPIFLNSEQMENFYDGFCNQTLWPLFHSFPTLTEFDDVYWNEYVSVNQEYCARLVEHIQTDDIVFINDYHLLLLPGMLREVFPELKICFFLHIPFPNFEIFRLLPSRWRRDILDGMTAADVVGFHTYEYREYFLQCVRRFLGRTHWLGEIATDCGYSRAETFPMGIDFTKYSTPSGQHPPTVLKRILSIDRLDYTKGILSRLKGFELFLREHPEYERKIQLHVVAVPSRIGVNLYQNLRNELDELVGHINGIHSKDGWSPIYYEYKTLSTEEVIALYRTCEIALVTPLRDGMNLIAKEYLAARIDNTGVLILSEMAGAASELSNALLVNPNSNSEIAEAIYQAIELSTEEQIKRNAPMRAYLAKQNIHTWMQRIMDSLELTQHHKHEERKRALDSIKSSLLKSFTQAKNPIILLDYDGTLVSFTPKPEDAKPDKMLLELLRKLGGVCEIFIVTGRNKVFLDENFQDVPISFIAEHGAFLKLRHRKKWQRLLKGRTDWIDGVFPIFEKFHSRIYGSFLEQKECSLVFHYRDARGDAEFVREKVLELYETLLQFTTNLETQVLHGHAHVEMRTNGINKGKAILSLPQISDHDFYLAVGDDTTDEDMFRLLPEMAYTIKVGREKSSARFFVQNTAQIRVLLEELSVSRRN